MSTERCTQLTLDKATLSNMVETHLPRMVREALGLPANAIRSEDKWLVPDGLAAKTHREVTSTDEQALEALLVLQQLGRKQREFDSWGMTPGSVSNPRRSAFGPQGVPMTPSTVANEDN